MFPTVVIRQPGQTPIHLSVREPIEVGRECTGVVLVDPQVSRRHLVLAPVGDRIAVMDLGSTNGTILHGRRLDIEMELMAGQFIKIGDTTITVLDERSSAQQPSARQPSARQPSATTTTGNSGDLATDDPGRSTTMLPSASAARHGAEEHTPASEWSRRP